MIDMQAIIPFSWQVAGGSGQLWLAERRKAVSPLRSATALQNGEPKLEHRPNLECGGSGEVRAGDTAFLQESGVRGQGADEVWDEA
jgi:hypothetical protein